MSGRATLVLMGVMVGLVALYWGTERIEEVKKREVVEARRFFEFDGSDVATLTIQRRGEEPVSALRSAEAVWSIVEPYETIPASQLVWDHVADTLSLLSNQRTLEMDSVNISDFGLNDAHLLIMAGIPGGEILQITFGALEPTQVNRYVQVTGGDIILVPERSVQEMYRSLDDLRDRRLITLDPSKFERVELTQRQMVSEADAGGSKPEPLHSVFGYDAAGTWVMTEPSEGPADQELLNRLIVGLFQSVGRAYRDVPESLIDYGLVEPAYEVTVHSASADPQTLSIGWLAELGEEGGYYAKREDSPSVFIVDSPLVKFLESSPNLFREGRLFTGAATDLLAINYQDSTTTIRLENDPEVGWLMTEPQVNDTDQQFVSMYIRGLKLLRAVSFPDEAVATGLDPPRIRLTLEFSGTDETSTIEVGDVIPGTQAAQFYARQDNGAVVAIPIAAEMLLRSRPFDFRRKTIFDFPPEQAAKLTLSLDSVDYIFDKDEEGWRVTEPVGWSIESQDDITGLLETLRLVEALGVAEPAPSEAVHGLDSPILTAQVVLENPANIRARPLVGPLRVGNLKAPQSRQRFVTIGGRSDVYYVDQGVLDEVRSALRGVIAR